MIGVKTNWHLQKMVSTIKEKKAFSTNVYVKRSSPHSMIGCTTFDRKTAIRSMQQPAILFFLPVYGILAYFSFQTCNDASLWFVVCIPIFFNNRNPSLKTAPCFYSNYLCSIYWLFDNLNIFRCGGKLGIYNVESTFHNILHWSFVIFSLFRFKHQVFD